MFHEINQQLEEARQGVFRLQKIKSMIENYVTQKQTLEQKIEELNATLKKEDLDVQKLEGKSLNHIFYSVLGNLEEKVQKEQQEALAARLKFDQAVLELENITHEIEKLKSEKSIYAASERKYQELFARKKELLLQSNSVTAEQILSLTEQISASNNTIKEIREAISAGSTVTNYLNETLDSLNSAEGWGTWDLLGGGLISDMIKHGHIDDAKSGAEQTQRALSRFKTELADIKISSNINIETDGFAKFADFFFDGLIADWCMQSRINESQDSVISVKNQVQMVMSKLSRMENELKDHIKHLENSMNGLIAQTEG